MKVFGGRRKTASGVLIAGLAGFSLLTVGHGQRRRLDDDRRGGLRLRDHRPDQPDRGSFSIPELSTPVGLNTYYDCVADDPATTDFDESDCPTGVGNTPLAGFPTAGATYGVLTSGNAALADDPNVLRPAAASPGTAQPPASAPASSTAWSPRSISPAGDDVVPCLRLPVPVRRVPRVRQHQLQRRLHRPARRLVRDRDPTTRRVNAPGNFAGGTGDTISVDANGPECDDRRRGARDDVRRRDGPADRPRACCGRIGALAVPDDLRPGRRDPRQRRVPRQPPVTRTSTRRSASRSALDPYDGTTGVSLVPGNPPKLSKDLKTLTIPVSCNLPPGPVSCS